MFGLNEIMWWPTEKRSFKWQCRIWPWRMFVSCLIRPGVESSVLLIWIMRSVLFHESLNRLRPNESFNKIRSQWGRTDSKFDSWKLGVRTKLALRGEIQSINGRIHQTFLFNKRKTRFWLDISYFICALHGPLSSDLSKSAMPACYYWSNYFLIITSSKYENRKKKY